METTPMKKLWLLFFFLFAGNALARQSSITTVKYANKDCNLGKMVQDA
jgi:hypothetical protein